MARWCQSYGTTELPGWHFNRPQGRNDPHSKVSNEMDSNAKRKITRYQQVGYLLHIERVPSGLKLPAC